MSGFRVAVAALVIGLVIAVTGLLVSPYPGRIMAFFRPAAPAKSVISPEAPPSLAEVTPAATAPPALDRPPPASTPEQMGRVRLATTPAGSKYALYPESLIELPPPTTAPLRVGTTPAEVEGLPAGHYTVFFQNLGWAVDCAEITVAAGEAVPLDFNFPHGRAEITSEPEGAQIFHRERWLGKAPLTVELPPGEQQLVARMTDRPERTQTVKIENLGTTTISFAMRTVVSRRARETPTPSALEKLTRSVKKVFKSEPTPKRGKR